MTNEIEVGIKVNGPWWVSAVYWSQVAWRAALSALLLIVAWQAYNLRNLPDWTERQITRESNATRGAALAAITDTRKDLLGQVASTRSELLGEVANLRKDVMARTDTVVSTSQAAIADIAQKADTRLADLSVKVDAQLTRTNDFLAVVTGGLKPVLEHAGSIGKQVDDTAPLFLDCEYNPDCVFNRFQGTSKAIERMAQAGATAAPKLAESAISVGKSVAGIADDAHKEADEFLKPKTFKQKVADWLGMIPRIVKLIL